MTDTAAIWLFGFVLLVATWAAWRWLFGADYSGGEWRLFAGVWLALALAAAVVTAHASTFAEREAYRAAHPRPPGATLLDRLPPCDGLGFSDPAPLWVARGDDVRMVHEQLDLCALVRRGAIQSVATREGLCVQLERLVFPLVSRAVCGVT